MLTAYGGWLAADLRADPLAEVARVVEGQARRASSGLFDPESNMDAWHIGPGQRQVLTELEGPGEIRHMWFTLAGRDRRYPRTAVLRIWWDDAQHPSVETPFGDFFAAGNGMRANVSSPPVEVTSYGRALNCYWRMPFRRKARIEVANDGRHDLTVYWQFDWMKLPKAPDDMVYFHARYRQECPTQTFSPYVIFEGRGAGHYVGTVFSLQCSYGSWFGESDDRFYIDGEAEPSIVGTGCEDYFNDAWNFRLFSNENTGVTIKEPNAEDCRFTAYRWHVRAPITFSKSLKVEIERRSFIQNVDPATGRSTQYDFKYRPDFCSSVAYWYQREVAEPFAPFPPVAERINPEIVVEVADLADQIRTSGGTVAREKSNRTCNLKHMLHVENKGPGGWFEVPCRVDEAGRYSISVFQSLHRTGGLWKVTLKRPAGEILLSRAMDFYDPYLAWKENRPENFVYGTWFEQKVGLHRLEPGDYVFRFECVGANPLSRARESDAPGYDCALDGISLRRFPWDDLNGMLQRYLAEEDKLFKGRIEEATRTVTALAAAIERFRKDTGAYPRDLDELGARPQRLAGVAGHWPYADVDRRDPWGQRYRYVVPGLFNPHSFDVYSVHGNSRSAGTWIGNWPSPYRWPGAVEAEDLEPARKGDALRVLEQELRLSSAPPLSNGRLLFVRSAAVGDWIELPLPDSPEPRAGRLSLRLVTSWDYAIVKISLNGRPLGEPVDAFSPKTAARTIDLGAVEFKPSGNRLRLEAIGRNPASSGMAMGIDALRIDRPDE
ncbi:MAG: DUF2961 domain-containing protein [Phycisphaerae bacterium]|jgi:hypothetical protein